jgi:hypothetical protein
VGTACNWAEVGRSVVNGLTIPPCTGDVGNVSATLKDGQEALIVGAGTPDALADAMVALANDTER